MELLNCLEREVIYFPDIIDRISNIVYTFLCLGTFRGTLWITSQDNISLLLQVYQIRSRSLSALEHTRGI